MIHIVGGTYIEQCLEPSWNQLYGSGVRAASALMHLCDHIILSTYVSKRLEPTLKVIANTYGFEAHLHESNITYRFSYSHALSTPQIFPPLGVMKKEKSIEIKCEHLLRFGFIEGDAIVHGTNVVYDPQSAYDPQPFRKNGSTAIKLAIVANAREAVMLTNEKGPQEAGQKLSFNEKAEVVIIKCGTSGALLFSSGTMTQIPIFHTETVWPIGSGDVFTAVFAHFWACQSQAPEESAKRASMAAAYYCSKRFLPIPTNFEEKFKNDHLQSCGLTGSELRPKVYLAGPFFNMMQKWLINEARQTLLEQGLAVFSPLHDVGRGPAEEIAVADLAGLDDCVAVFAIADGLDSGTIFEIGYARARKIPVVVFVQSEREEDLKMFKGTGCEIENDFATAIYKVRWACIKK